MYELELYYKNRNNCLSINNYKFYMIMVNKYESYYKEYSDYMLLSLKVDNDYNLEEFEKIFLLDLFKKYFKDSIKISKEIVINSINYYSDGFCFIYNDSICMKISDNALTEVSKIVRVYNDNIDSIKLGRVK